jgi:hypothetical protein
MALLHFVQGLVVVWLSRDFRLPLTTNYLTFNEKTQALEPAVHTLANVSLPWLIAGFFFICALAHLIIATVYRQKYESDLKLGINKARWWEYSASASTMMVAIAMLVGIYDLGALLMLFTLTAGMNLMGLVMEVHNQTTKKTSWLSFNIGCLLGIVPWVVVAIFFWAANAYGAGDIPTFVYWIYGSIFVFFNIFALNMWLQYKKVGKWAEYLYGERAYMILSLVAKSLLAWQVFGGTLRP